MDFALVEVVDIDVVVVIRFVAMESIPKKRVAQEKWEAKSKIMKQESLNGAEHGRNFGGFRLLINHAQSIVYVERLSSKIYLS